MSQGCTFVPNLQRIFGVRWHKQDKVEEYRHTRECDFKVRAVSLIFTDSGRNISTAAHDKNLFLIVQKKSGLLSTGGKVTASLWHILESMPIIKELFISLTSTLRDYFRAWSPHWNVGSDGKHCGSRVECKNSHFEWNTAKKWDADM